MAKKTVTQSKVKGKVAGKDKKEKTIRLGVVGLGRGQSFFGASAKALGFELVALCDLWEEKLLEIGKRHNVATYTDYDKFLEHDMDAVVLANFFHEHAPFAIKALKAGKHVMSETAACKTIAEGVELCRTVEQTGKVYMFAENYPYSLTCQELRRVYQTGDLGKVLYADGEYNHPINRDSPYYRRLAPTLNHWRNWCPSTYYCTHALAPLMYMTDTMPVSVNALATPWPDDYPKKALRRSDAQATILCKMDNDAIFRLFGISAAGHSVWYRMHGTQGAAELGRPNGGQVRVWYEEDTKPKGEVREKSYTPSWPEHADLANKAGHGGGDFWTNLHFARGIRNIEPVYLDVYRGVAMSVVGPQAWRSVLDGGRPYEIPDFKNEKSRKKYENDNYSPFPEDAGKQNNGQPQPPPSIKGMNAPSPKLIKSYLKQVKDEQTADMKTLKAEGKN